MGGSCRKKLFTQRGNDGAESNAHSNPCRAGPGRPQPDALRVVRDAGPQAGHGRPIDQYNRLRVSMNGRPTQDVRLVLRHSEAASLVACWRCPRCE